MSDGGLGAGIDVNADVGLVAVSSVSCCCCCSCCSNKGRCNSFSI